MQCLDDRLQKSVVGIDRERNFLRAATHALAERARVLELQMTRRRPKEHEANHVGAGVQRGVKRLRRRQSANFDGERHLPRVPARPGLKPSQSKWPEWCPFYIA